ncbi:hypothetical protein QUF94_05935 [Peribacillus sp. NJ4]|uniref:hypothetical protein n=1 Tax=Peribacillus sp. NJ4 TaxID=3055862 RepID=UPI0025A0EEBF|nr:hypothetical protein [Peribacillus sp. NJ4]MDM5210974.1 hypothetical protein [Peribacillus sp. NJ4]
MVTIQTYISKNSYDAIINKHLLANGDFIPIHHSSAKQLGNQKLFTSKGTSLYGTVIISYQDQFLSSFYDWDDVDGIWLSILQAMYDCLNTGIGSCDYSERSMDWQVKRLMEKNPDISFTWNHGFASKEWNDMPKISTLRFPENVLLNSLIEKGTKFLKFRNALYDSGPSQNINQLINDLKSFSSDLGYVHLE